MEDHIKQALEIVKAQASVRNMTEEEITSMLNSLAQKIKGIADESEAGTAQKPAIEPNKAIKEKTVTCLECGKSFKMLSKKHLASHNLTPEEYRHKWGYKKTTSLVAKSLARQRRKKMQEMRLWEKRTNLQK